MKEETAPFLLGLICSLSSLCAFWAAQYVYRSEPGMHAGAGFMASLLVMPLVFVIALALAGAIFGGVLAIVKASGARLYLVLGAFVIFFLGHGKPSMIEMIIAMVAFPFGYFHHKKTRTDADDLDHFMQSNRATKITPEQQYLRQFPSPLWDALDLEHCTPLSVIEGKLAAHPFMIIEMRHLAHGLLAENGEMASSTFFVINHLKNHPGLRITQYPRQFQISADSHYVYLVSTSKKVKPGEWEFLLEQTMQVVDGLVVADAPDGPAASNVSNELPARTYTPVGAGRLVHAFWTVVALLFAGLSFAYGMGGLLGLTKLAPTWAETSKLGLQCLLAGLFFLFGAWISWSKYKKRA